MEEYCVKYVQHDGTIHGMSIKEKKVYAIDMIKAYYLINKLDNICGIFSLIQINKDGSRTERITEINY